MIINISKIKNKKLNKFLVSYNKYKTPYICPKFKSIVINTNLGTELSKNEKLMEESTSIFKLITNQKPKIIGAKKAISNFKIKQKDKIALSCTIKKKKLYIFLTKLIFFVIPQLEFWNKNITNLDYNYNLNFGLNEHLIFPEIGYSFNKKSFGLNININFEKTSITKGNLHLLKLLNLI